MDKERNIFPVTDLLDRQAKEQLLQQHSKVLWLTGLSGSGKTTIARELEKLLQQHGRMACLLDGDNIRTGINNNLGFSETDRQENIRRIAEVAKLFLQNGIICIACFVSPTVQIRQLAQNIIGENDFMEIFINTPLEVCEQRDVKGLYDKARKGLIPDFTGISAPFEAPQTPFLSISTENQTPIAAAQEVFNALLPHLKYSSKTN
ncbi:MAG: adenylyl-sulfate kinase [Chitinophagales bacterium]|nr:adenylyl-sulfate kinase [Bacteroidota bacterium]